MVDGFVGGVELQEAIGGVTTAGAPSMHPSLRLPPIPLTSKQSLRLKLELSLIAVDVASIAAAFLISSFIRFGSVTDEKAFNFVILMVPWYVLVAANNRAYGVEVLLSFKSGGERALVALATSAALLAGLLFYLKTGALYSRQVVGVGVFLSAILILTGRWVFLSVVVRNRRLKLTNDVLLIDGAAIRPESGEIVIIADTAGEPNWEPLILDRIGTFLHHADRVIVAASEDRRRRWVSALKGVGVDVEILATELARFGPLGLRRYGPHPTLVVGSKPLGLSDSFKKRALDLAICVPALILLAPLFLLIAAAIKLDSRGPVFFRQARLGQGNRIFRILKFRTMGADNTDLQGTRSASRDDDRVTRFGHFLRRSSFDELPQLFNVLTGDMSLVGPRPHALGSTAEHALFWNIEGRYWERHGIKPGITGLAQVRGYRGATETKADVTNRVQSDLEYRVGWSLSRDIAIIFRTIRVLIHPNAF